MQGKVIFEGFSENGTPFYIRYPRDGDAEKMMEYIHCLSDEQTYILYQGEKISLEEEKKFLKNILSKIEDKREIFLLCFSGDKLIAELGISLLDRVEKHVGNLGISVAKGYRGERIGKKLFEIAMEESTKLTDLRIIILGVFACNDLAFSIYKKYGYKEYGRLPKGILHKGTYVDHILMFKELLY